MFFHTNRLNGRVTRLLFLFILILLAVITALPSQPAAAASGGRGIVHSVVKAPIVPDGDVAGEPTDVVINLDRSLDPSVVGRTLLKGNQIKITLPTTFVNTGLPGQTIFTPGCSPPSLQCSTGILLQGWPQHPIFPMFPPASGPPTLYTTSLEGTHTLVFTALQDVVPGVLLPGPGIKQIHLFAVGFVNPSPGQYPIEVMAQTGPGGSWESGTGRLNIVPRAKPSINITSVFNGLGNPNTIYQQAGVNEVVNLPYDFLLWDYDGVPFTDVDIEMVNSRHAVLRQGNAVVGHVVINAPRGAQGVEVVATSPSFAINAPLSGIPTARLTASFTTGSEAGLYIVTFSLNGGNSVKMHVVVE